MPSGRPGSAERRPEKAEDVEIEAKFEDGILTVHMPKTSAARGRKIEVRG